MKRTVLSLFILVALSASAAATDYPAGRVLTHREQAPLIHGWIQKRFDTILPDLMRREKIDMWVIV